MIDADQGWICNPVTKKNWWRKEREKWTKREKISDPTSERAALANFTIIAFIFTLHLPSFSLSLFLSSLSPTWRIWKEGGGIWPEEKFMRHDSFFLPKYNVNFHIQVLSRSILSLSLSFPFTSFPFTRTFTLNVYLHSRMFDDSEVEESGNKIFNGRSFKSVAKCFKYCTRICVRKTCKKRRSGKVAMKLSLSKSGNWKWWRERERERLALQERKNVIPSPPLEARTWKKGNLNVNQWKNIVNKLG